MTKIRTERDNLEYYLAKLVHRTSFLKQVGMLLFIIIIADLLILSFSIFALRNELNTPMNELNNSINYNILFLLILALSLLGFILLVSYLHLLKNGNVLYEEIVDELEWKYKRNVNKDFERQPIETRIILKDYVQSRDLLFTNGKHGQSIYLLLIIFFLVFSLYINSLLV